MSATDQASTPQPQPQPRTSKSSTNLKDKQIKSKDSSKCTSPTKSEEKRLPPIKAPVGLAKNPDLKNVKSKIGSFQNLKHVPAKGEKKQITQKLEWKASSKIGSLDYTNHKPAGGDKKVLSQKLEWNASSKIGSLENMRHRPGGGQIKIFNERYGSVRSYSEVRKPRQPSTVRSTSPTNAKLNAKLNGQIDTNTVNSAKSNNEHSSRTVTSRINSGINGTVNGSIPLKQETNNSKLINNLSNLNINSKPQINNTQKTAPTDLLS